MTSFTSLTNHLTKSFPRLLTQLCRDKDNPLYGCFDRNFWHYKTRDFPSMVLQQPVYVLDMVSRGELSFCDDLKINKNIVNEWVDACLKFWSKSQRKNGSFDEYYPYESGFPPTAFSLYSTALVCKHRDFDNSIMVSMERAASFILKKPEVQALNQEIVGLTACSLVKDLGGEIDCKRLNERWDDLFSSQSSEGWFNEYDGADSGYLSVSCDALFDYFEVKGDERAMHAITNATDYLFHLLAMDDSIPAMINSRNTDYVLPYGLTQISKDNAQAGSIIKRLVQGIDKPTHYLHSIDDRYLTHYVYTSWYRCLPNIGNISKNEPLVSKGKWFKDAGILIVHNPEKWSIHVAASKGGIVVKTNHDGTVTKNLGWRSTLQEGFFACTHWQEPESKYTMVKDGSKFSVQIEMPLRKHRFIVPTPSMHICLRILSRIFGNRIIPVLKNIMIFRSSKLKGYYKRKIFLKGPEVEIFDSFHNLNNLTWTKAGWSSLRHVSSAGSFCKSEVQNRDDFILNFKPKE